MAPTRWQEPSERRVRGRAADARRRRCRLHAACSEARPEGAHRNLIEQVVRPVVSEHLLDEATKYFVDPPSRFVVGGPFGDAVLTGRKIIVESNGGRARIAQAIGDVFDLRPAAIIADHFLGEPLAGILANAGAGPGRPPGLAGA